MSQKRNLGVDGDHDGSGSSLGGSMIKINVSHALYYEVFIPAQSTFWDVKKLLMKKTGLDPKQQRLFFNGKEKDDEENLHTEGVSDKTRLLLLEGLAKKERKLEESRECDEVLKASKAVAGVRSEVDKLSERMVTLEAAVDAGTKVSEEEFQGLTNLLMRQLTKLDTIEAQGEAKLQQKAEVLRVQNFVDTLESLKARNSDNAVKLEKLPLQKTGLEPEEQCRFSRGKEKENEEHLHMEDANKKTKLEESRARLEMMKASEAVDAVRSEVDELSERVAALEVAVDSGAEVSKNEFQTLTELLMKQLLKLDTIEAKGEAKLQRKAEVLRVQNFVDTLESLKARNSDNAVKLEKLPLQKTGLEREEQRRFSRGKEKGNEEHLHMEDANKKTKLEESRARLEMMKASEAVDAVRSEVDELSERVAALEVVVDAGAEVSKEEFQMLNELLMKQLLKLDTIEAKGEVKLQRKAEVLRVQKFVDTVDSLKARNSDPFNYGVRAGMENYTWEVEDPIAEETCIYSQAGMENSTWDMEDSIPEETCLFSHVFGRTSQQREVHTEELVPWGSFPDAELERPVVGDSLPEEDDVLLSKFFSIHPSMLLTNPDHSDQFISFGYSSLVRLLRFLEHHTPASMDESRRLAFLKMLRDLGSLGFNGEWLAQTKEIVLGSLLSFKEIDTQLQGLMSSEEVLMKKLKFLESKRRDLSFSLDRLSKEVQEVECSLTDVREKLFEARELKRKKDVHLGSSLIYG